MNSYLLPDWDSLRVVLHIDRAGGLSGAARVLGVTHATISRRLARAEEAAGVSFFERLPAGLRLTSAGRAVLEHAERVEAETHGLERALMAEQPGLSGPLRVTVPPLLMSAPLTAQFGAFLREHPGIELHFVGDNAPLNLHRREADVALRVSARPPDTLWGRKVTEQSAGYYASPDWLAQHPLGQGDLGADVPVVSFTAWPEPIPEGLRRTCPRARVALRVDDMVLALRLVRQGLGVTRLPKVIGEEQGLARVERLTWEPYPPIWLLTHPELRAVPRVEALMAHLGTAMKRLKSEYVHAPLPVRAT